MAFEGDIHDENEGFSPENDVEYTNFSNIRALKAVEHPDSGRNVKNHDKLDLVNVEDERNPYLETYDPDKARLLEAERMAYNEGEAAYAHRVFTRNIIPAVHSIVHLAAHAQNERIRLQAAQIVTDRVLGRVQDNPPAPPADPFQALLGQVVRSMTAEELSALGDGASPESLGLVGDKQMTTSHLPPVESTDEQ